MTIIATALFSPIFFNFKLGCLQSTQQNKLDEIWGYACFVTLLLMENIF